MRASGERDRATPLGVSAVAALLLACVNVKANGAGATGVTGTGTAGTSAGAAGALATGGAGGGAGVFGSGTAGAAGTSMSLGCQGQCTDFPATPLIDIGITPDAAAMFTIPPLGAGPCITEPEDGSLFPNNWLRPRVKLKGVVPGTLHEIRFHSPMEANDLVAFTTSDAWTMPRAIWLGLAAGVQDSPITVTVRDAGGGASTVAFTIAPVPAPGSIVFWATNPADHGNPKPTSSSLQGFAPGDESTVTTLGVGDVQMQTRGPNNALRAVTCIGCHNSTPDGESVGFIDNYPWSMAIAGVSPGRAGLIPMMGSPDGYVTVGGIDTIRQPGMGIFSFSKAHWTTGDRIAVSPYYLDMPCGHYDQKPTTPVQLAWLNLEAPPVDNGCPVAGTHFGIIARTGDPRGAGNPSWSHDGKTIVYSSTDASEDGRLGTGTTDLYTVPYNDRAGGPATPLAGASEVGVEEYYPAFSPDDALVVFDGVPAGTTMYANPMAELFVIPAPGAPKALRLVANDPPTCSGTASPGINNHWAKWAPAPEIAPATGKKYYWLIFSSNRYGTPPVTADDMTVVPVSQLYATAIVVDETSTQTFPAIYLWNQSSATLNTTPAWDPFKIPSVP